MDAPPAAFKPRATAIVLSGCPEMAAQKGEAYRKALKARLRAAVPRSLRKATFRIAGMDDPFVQLDSQKLKELEKLEVWLKQHFPMEMECDPVAVPRDKLRQLVDRLSVSFAADASPPAPDARMFPPKLPSVKPVTPATVSGPRPSGTPQVSGRHRRGIGGVADAKPDASGGGTDRKHGVSSDNPYARVLSVPGNRKRKPAPVAVDELDSDDDAAVKLEQAGQLFHASFEQLTRAASLTGIIESQNDPITFSATPPPSSQFTPFVHGRGPLSQPRPLSQFAGGSMGSQQRSRVGSSQPALSQPPQRPPIRASQQPLGTSSGSQPSVGQDIFTPLTYHDSQEGQLLHSFGVGGSGLSRFDSLASLPAMAPPRPVDTLSQALLEGEVPLDDVYTSGRRQGTFGGIPLMSVPLPLPKPHELPASQVLELTESQSQRLGSVKDSPALSSWTSVSALLRNTSMQRPIQSSPLAATASSSLPSTKLALVKDHTGSEKTPMQLDLSPALLNNLLTPSEVDRLFGASFSMSPFVDGADFTDWIGDDAVAAAIKSSRNWMAVCGAFPVIPSAPAPSLYDPLSLSNLYSGLLDSLPNKPGLVTVEAVCGRLAAFRYACSQTPFDVIQLFVDASPDGQMLYFESDGCTADPVNVASLFHEEVRNAFTVILVGKHAKTAARELFATGKVKACVGIEVNVAQATPSQSSSTQDLDSSEVSEAISSFCGALLTRMPLSDASADFVSSLESLSEDVCASMVVFPEFGCESIVPFTVAPDDSARPVLIGKSLPRLKFYPWNVPQVVCNAPLFGRHAELLELLSRFRAPTSRFICLNGVVGSGKSAVMLHAATHATFRGWFSDGIAWVSVSKPSAFGSGGGSTPKQARQHGNHQRELELVCRSVASQLGLAWQSGLSCAAGSNGVTSLCQSLHGCDALVVFDDCVNNVGVVHTLAKGLLENTPSIRVVLSAPLPADLQGSLIGSIGASADSVVLELPPLPKEAALALFAHHCPMATKGSPPGSSQDSSELSLNAADPPLPARKRLKPSSSRSSSPMSILSLEAVENLVSACGFLPDVIVSIAEAVTCGSCDYDTALAKLGTSSRKTQFNTHLAATLVVAALSSNPDLSLHRLARMIAHFPQDVTVEDAAALMSLPESRAAELLDTLCHQWHVVTKDYRNGSLYRVRPEFAVALKYSAKQGTRRDADRVLLNCAVCDCDSAPYRLTFRCSTPDAQDDKDDGSVSAAMARMSARCLEILVGLQQTLVQSDGQISGTAIGVFNRTFELVVTCVDWLTAHAINTKSKLMALLSLMIVNTSSQLLQYAVPQPFASDMLLKQRQVCTFLCSDSGPIAQVDVSGTAGALLSPSRSRKLDKARHLESISQPLILWLTDTILLQLATIQLENSDYSEGKAVVTAVSSRLDIVFPGQASRPSILAARGAAGPSRTISPPASSSTQDEETDTLDFALNILACAAADARPSSSSDPSPLPACDDLFKYQAVTKAQCVVLYAKIAQAQREDYNTAVACFQSAIGFLDRLLPACRDGSDVLMGRSGCRDVLTVTMARVLGIAMTGIGNIYNDRESFEQALSSYQNAYRVRLTYLGPYHPDTAESLYGIGHCLTQLKKASEAVEQLKKAHAIQLQALENTGKYDGSPGLALADTAFALATAFRALLTDPVTADSMKSGSSDTPSERQLQDTIQHCFTLCLFLRATLQGCHPSTVLAYAELADFFDSQRRFGSALACYNKAFEHANVIFEGFNNNCDCLHKDIVAYAGDVGDILMKMRNVVEAEKQYMFVLSLQQMRLACPQRHLDGGNGMDQQDLVAIGLLDVARAQRHIGTVDSLVECLSNLTLASAAVGDNVEATVRLKLERAKFHFVCHAVPDVAKATSVPISYDYPSSSATDEYFCVSVDLTLALQLLRDALCIHSDESGGVDVYELDDVLLCQLYIKCRVALGAVYRGLARSKRQMDPKVDVSTELSLAQYWYHAAVDGTVSSNCKCSLAQRSLAANGYASFLYERELFEDAAQSYQDALNWQRCVPSDDQSLIIGRIEVNLGLCHAKLAAKARQSGSPSPSVALPSQSPAASSTQSSGVIGQVRRAKAHFRKALLALLPNHVSPPASAVIDDTPSALPQLWFEGSLSASKLAQPWQVFPRIVGDATSVEFQTSHLRHTMACNHALEAHRALRNLSAVEFELKPDEQCLDEAQACLDAALAIVQTLESVISASDTTPIVPGFEVEVRDGAAICAKLQKRLDTAKARRVSPP